MPNQNENGRVFKKSYSVFRQLYRKLFTNSGQPVSLCVQYAKSFHLQLKVSFIYSVLQTVEFALYKSITHLSSWAWGAVWHAPGTNSERKLSVPQQSE